ncbi:MAG TPA: sulfite exporter TauE/SafE family protein [Devosiaceae bacterium]|jgi:hypothetical protein
MPEILGAIEPLYTLSGFVVGFIVGLTGVGGGSLMTPLLILLFGVHPATAVGTDLLYAAITKSAGTALNSHNNSVDWGIVARLAIGSVPAAAITIAILSFVGPQNADTTRIVSLVLGCMLVLTALTLFFRKALLGFATNHRELDPRTQTIATILVGAIIGVLVSISSVGAGAIGVSALMLLYPRLPTLRIVTSDIAHAVPLTLVAGAGHWLVGNVDAHMLVSLLLGSIPGILIASFFAPRLPEHLLRLVLATVLVVVGVKLVTG